MCYSRSLVAVFVLVLCAVLCGCKSSSFYAKARRQNLAQRYPSGEFRDIIHRTYGAPRSEHSVRSPDEFVVSILKSITPALRTKIDSYDIFWISWAYPNHSSYSSRIYADYIFYDIEGFVVWTERVFVD